MVVLVTQPEDGDHVSHDDGDVACCTEPLRKTEVDDPEVVVVVGVGEHDVERLEVEVEDPLAVDELDSPEKDVVEEKTWWKSQNSPHYLTDEDLALPFC